MRFIKTLLILFSLVLLIPIFSVILHADDGGLIAESNAGSSIGIGARAMGMGGAHIAAVLDGTALIYNPAALTRIRKMEILGGISHQSFENSTRHWTHDIPVPGFNSRLQRNSRLNNIILTIPYPTYRGSMVFSIGLNRIKSFDKTYQFGQIRQYNDGYSEYRGTEIETGSLYALSTGMGIDISSRLSLGVALSYYFGTDNYNWNLYYLNTSQNSATFIDDNIEDKYSGVSAKVGILFDISKRVKLGLTVESPISFSIDEKYTLNTRDTISNSEESLPGTYDYQLWQPFSFGFGTAINLNRLQLAADLKYTDWTQMEYQDDPALEAENQLIQSYYRQVVTINLGAEYLIPQIGLKLRTGYIYDPLPNNKGGTGSFEPGQQGFYIYDDREFITFGIGYLIDRVMTLDIAIVLGGYTIRDISEEVTENINLNRIYITTGFRL